MVWCVVCGNILIIMLQGKMFKLMDAKGTFLSDQLKEAIKDDKAEKEKEKLKGGRGGDRGGRGGGRCVFFHYCLAHYMLPRMVVDIAARTAHGCGFLAYLAILIRDAHISHRGGGGRGNKDRGGKSYTRGGGGGGPNRRGGRPPGPAGRDDPQFWKQVVDFLNSKEVLPVVIFTFGKHKCESCGYGLGAQTAAAVDRQRKGRTHAKQLHARSTAPCLCLHACVVC